ncbi:AI-2E family transporter [Sulfobacillus harzensis]|uniref:AI-2E family transporter n=1 Tax=Sulfobacillus harzensis TaxID=2729629 RepID=A0A7Y0L665_9FIRM|nr:AI-2E family transporter [Sulfobacillus harzensis]NMP23471.1 AI-2E family transporter [Sulfobacillus harzensis]
MPFQTPKRFRWNLAALRDLVLVVLGTATVIYGLGFLLSRLGRVVLILILAIIFTITLSPLVDRLANHWRRPWAVLVVVLGAVLVIVGGGAILGIVITGQLVTLVKHVPENVQHLSTLAPGLLSWLSHNNIHINIPSLENKILSNAGKVSSFIVSQTINIVTNVIGALVDGAIVLFVTVYWLLDAERMQLAILRLVPVQHRDLVLAAEHTLTRVVGGYVRGQLLLSAVVGSAFGLGSWAIGLSYPLLIGVLAGVMELIPLLGPVLGAIVPLIMALAGHPLVQVPEVAVLFAAVHLLESQILGPRIIRSQVGLHPVLSVLALMIGADWQGVWGALFAVPAAGIVVAAWVAAVRLWRERVVLPSQQVHRSSSETAASSTGDRRNILPEKGV